MSVDDTSRVWVPRREIRGIDELKPRVSQVQQTQAVGVQLGKDIAGSVTKPQVVGIRGTPISLTAPADGQVLKFNAALNKWVPGTSSAGGTGFLSKVVRYWVAALNNSISSSILEYGFGFGNWNQTGAGNALIGADGTNPSAIKLSTGAGTQNAQAHWQGDNGGDVAVPFAYGPAIKVAIKFLPTTAHTNSRYWLGWYSTQSNPPTQFKNTIPSSNVIVAAFRYDDSADSGVWQAFYQDSSTVGHQTVATTNFVFTPSGTAPVFQIVWDGTNLIYSINGAVVATITPAIPPLTTTVANPFVSIDNSLTGVGATAVVGSLFAVYQEEG